MDDLNVSVHYSTARRRAVKEYTANISRGKPGHLPFLGGMLNNVDIVSEVDLGIVEVPLKKIVGTYTHSRSTTFASNFMPLLPEGTEFSSKWKSLCEVHLKEGIRDPIKVYEYLNWFYVVEGNKRVSVLKYFGAYSISAKVTRLIPAKDEKDPTIKIYYEFLEFYKKTGINSIWFSKENRFKEMLDYLEEFEPSLTTIANKYKYFTNSVYLPFRRVYLKLGGGRLPITTGDAFLEYIKVYGLSDDSDEEVLKSNLKKFLTELEQFAEDEDVVVHTEPLPDRDSKILTTISSLVRPKRKLKVSFVYPGIIEKSNWTYSHNWGRLHVENKMKDQVSTYYIENVPEDIRAYEYLKQLAEEGSDIIFATSPAFINATLKAALEYTHVKFFNCSQTHSFRHVTTYFGRIYEPRFLVGIIAGALTRSKVLGYVATYPIPEVISGVNSFTLGARMVNPDVKVKVAWTNAWDSDQKSREASIKLIQSGADIISHHNTLGNREFCKEFGVYYTVCSVDKENCVPKDYLASPVWNWGIFYEKIITTILKGNWNSAGIGGGSGSKLINFWWGMDSGIVDVFYSSRLVPRQTAKLVDFMKKMIENNAFHPFSGPIYDRQGNLRVERDQISGHDDILSMDWLVEGVEGELPEVQKYGEDHDLLTGMLGD